MTNLGDLPFNQPVSADGLDAATARALGLSQAGVNRRGVSENIPNESLTSNANVWATAPTPDRVTDVELPTGGVIWVASMGYMLLAPGANGDGWIGVWITPSGGSARAVRSRWGNSGSGSSGIFGQKLLGPSATTEAVWSTEGGDDGFSVGSSGASGPSLDFSVGHVGGVPVPIFVDPGTYTVELRFMRTAVANIQVANRRLYVKAEDYG
jgi:hypothetical protein